MTLDEARIQRQSSNMRRPRSKRPFAIARSSDAPRAQISSASTPDISKSATRFRFGARKIALSPTGARRLATDTRIRFSSIAGGRKRRKQDIGSNRLLSPSRAGRDGFLLARWLRTRGLESHVIHPSSVAVSREHWRAKTDRLDAELLKRAFCEPASNVDPKSYRRKLLRSGRFSRSRWRRDWSPIKSCENSQFCC